MNPLTIGDLLRMAEEDKKAAIAEAEARGYARGLRAAAQDVLSTQWLSARDARHLSDRFEEMAERTTNVAPATGHASNAAAE